MSLFKLNGSAGAALMVLAVLGAGTQTAIAGTTTLICQKDPLNGRYEDEPTTIDLNEAEKSVTVHFAANHLRNPQGVHGGADGLGGAPAHSDRSNSATFSDDAITFSSSDCSECRYTINRLTGTFTQEYHSAEERWTCHAGKKQF